MRQPLARALVVVLARQLYLTLTLASHTSATAPQRLRYHPADLTTTSAIHP